VRLIDVAVASHDSNLGPNIRSNPFAVIVVTTCKNEVCQCIPFHVFLLSITTTGRDSFEILFFGVGGLGSPGRFLGRTVDGRRENVPTDGRLAVRNFFDFLRSLALVFVIAAAALLVGDATPLSAGGVVGNGTSGSCTETALTAALAGGGTVTFNCGGPKTILVTSQKTITQDTAIQGGGIITITGGLTTRLFDVLATASLTLNDITLDSFYKVDDNGGAIRSSGTLLLYNVTIQTSQTGLSYCGGAIFSSGATSIFDSKFSNNTSDYGGGAICTGWNSAATVQIVKSNFNNNRTVNSALTRGNGGAIFVNTGATVTVVDSAFVGNSAQFGGAIFVREGGIARLFGGGPSLQFNANSATLSGGAIYNFGGGTLNIVNAGFVGNSAPRTFGAGEGGAIANKGTLTLNNSRFRGNEGRFGGAVYAVSGTTGGHATISHTTFSENIAEISGGGLYAGGSTTVATVTDSSFDANSVPGGGTISPIMGGGGIARFDAQLTVSRSSFTHNTAVLGGGMASNAGPQIAVGGYVEVHDSTFGANTATIAGGGLFNSGLLNLQGVTIKDNSNGIYGATVVRMSDTVLQNPGGLNCDGSLPFSAGGNFSTDNSCGLSHPNDRQGTGLDPKLGPLTKDTFGLTSYYMPQARVRIDTKLFKGLIALDLTSPLINTAVPPCSPRDQRGASRPDACDIGAVEYGGLLLPQLDEIAPPK
jgi:Chlamydia polymorphic membrane protein (Chlamydia_PMP) repeat